MNGLLRRRERLGGAARERLGGFAACRAGADLGDGEALGVGGFEEVVAAVEGDGDGAAFGVAVSGGALDGEALGLGGGEELLLARGGDGDGVAFEVGVEEGGGGRLRRRKRRRCRVNGLLRRRERQPVGCGNGAFGA